MASYLDTQPYQFKPYVQTLPVEEMVKVGMAKQQQYNEGLQKARSYVESIANVDVFKPEHVNYINQTLEKVKSQLDTVASSDFSNQQLVNAVGGLAKQVYKDPNVQNMVADTTRFRKNYKMMQEALDKGEASPENVWDFMESQFQPWMSDGSTTSRFNGRYSPYVDVNKQWLDVVGKLHPSSNLKDIPYTTFTDPITGKIMATKDIARVMVEQEIKGINASDVEKALRATMNPSIQNQLAISGRYTFRDKTPDDLRVDVLKKYENGKKEYQEKIDALGEILKKQKAGSPDYQRTMDYINDYKDKLGLNGKPSQLDKDMQEELDYVTNNPEAAKIKLYKDQAIKQFADAFDWEESNFKYVKSWHEENRQWDEKQRLEWATFNEVKRHNAAQESLNWYEAETARLKAEKEGDADKPTSGGFTTTRGAGTEMPDAIDAMEIEKNGFDKQATSLGLDLASSFGLKGKNTDETLQKLDAYIYDYMYKGPNGGMDGTKVKPDQRDDVEAYINTRNMSKRITSAITEEQKKADAEIAKKFGTKDEILQKRAASMPNININTSDGERLTFTYKEIYDYLQKEKVNTSVSGAGPASVTRTIDDSKLTAKEQKLRNHWSKRYNSQLNLPFGLGSSKLDDISEGYIKDVEKVKGQLFDYDNARRELVNKGLASKANTWTPTEENIVVAKAEQKETMRGWVSQMLAGMEADEGDRVYGAGFSEAKNWTGTQDKGKDLTYSVIRQGRNAFLSLRSGGKEARIKLSPTELEQMPVKGKQDSEVLDVQQAISLGGGTTSTNGMPDGAYFQGNSAFKNVLPQVSAKGNIRKAKNSQKTYIEIILPTSQGYSSFILDKDLPIRESIAYIKNVSTANLLNDAYVSAMRDSDYNKAAEVKALMQTYLK